MRGSAGHAVVQCMLAKRALGLAGLAGQAFRQEDLPIGGKGTYALLGDGGGGGGFQMRRTMRLMFWPPKPKLLLMATWQRAGRAVLGT